MLSLIEKLLKTLGRHTRRVPVGRKVGVVNPRLANIDALILRDTKRKKYHSCRETRYRRRLAELKVAKARDEAKLQQQLLIASRIEAEAHLH